MRDSQATVALPLCETGPTASQHPLPRPLVWSQQPALLEPERSWFFKAARGEGSKMALFGLVSIRVALTQLRCLQSPAVPRPPPQGPSMTVNWHLLSSDHITLFYFVGQ